MSMCYFVLRLHFISLCDTFIPNLECTPLAFTLKKIDELMVVMANKQLLHVQ